MDRFVARENVRHFRRELENGADQPRRDTLLRLLVEEENLLGLTREQMDKLEPHIARLSEIMSRHVELMDGLRLRAQPTERAEIVFATYNDLMADTSHIPTGSRLRSLTAGLSAYQSRQPAKVQKNDAIGTSAASACTAFDVRFWSIRKSERMTRGLRVKFRDAFAQLVGDCRGRVKSDGGDDPSGNDDGADVVAGRPICMRRALVSIRGNSARTLYGCGAPASVRLHPSIGRCNEINTDSMAALDANAPSLQSFERCRSHGAAG